MTDNHEPARNEIYEDLLRARAKLADAIAWEVEPGLLKMVGRDGTTRLMLVRQPTSKQEADHDPS